MAILPRAKSFSLRQRPLGLLLAVLLLLIPAAGARAEPTGASRADLVLLLDRSGSMQKNDPGDLAATGAQVLVEMLDGADRVGVITFDTTARTLEPLGTLGDGQAARDALSGMGRPTGEWTDIKGALQAAAAMLNGQAQADRQPAILLFTDGQPQTQDDGVPAGYHEELQETVSLLAGRNIPVFTVGLGQADFALLERIASGTRAESFAATSATQVVEVFQEVLSRVKERHVVLSFEEELAPGAAGQVRTFQVPPYTRLLTLSAVGSGGSVNMKGSAPGGTPLADSPGLKTSRGGNYLVYTIPNPAPGRWTVQLEGAGRIEGHGQTESALRLSLLEPAPYSQVESLAPVPVSVSVAGDPDPQSPLEVWVQDGSGQPVPLARSSGANFAGEIQLRDGRLAVWAARAGQEVTRRQFRLYPMAAEASTLGTSGAATGEPQPNPWLPWLVTAGLALLAGLLLSAGAFRWRKLAREKGVLSGRLGNLRLERTGPEVRVGPGPALATKAGTPTTATLSARLVPRGWAPLAGLGLRGRELQIHIRPAPGVRMQINGGPGGDGRLYHGDSVTLGTETFTYSNPQLPRRPKGTAGTYRRMKGHGVYPSA